MTRGGIGDNSGTRLVEYQQLVEDKLKALDDWEKIKVIPDEEVAERMRDFIAGVNSLLSDVDAMRKDEKQPFLDQANRVDDRWNPLKNRLQRVADWAKAKLDAYMREKKRQAEERERIAREAAAAERRKQEDAARKAAEAKRASDRIEAEARAAEAAKNAKRAERVADKAAAPTRVASATGMTRAAGFAKERKAQVTDPKKAFAALIKSASDRAALIEEMERLANARIRASRGADITIPGFEITEQDKLRA